MSGLAYVTKQRGVTLIVGMVMLMLISLIVFAAYRLNATNLQAVGNMQFRNEAISAANAAIESSLGLTTVPASGINVDLNNDGASDYQVTLTRACQGFVPVQISLPAGAGCSLSASSMCNFKQYTVVWDYQAVVNNTQTGASATIHQGIKQLLTQAQCNSLCPPAAGVECK